MCFTLSELHPPVSTRIQGAGTSICSHLLRIPFCVQTWLRKAVASPRVLLGSNHPNPQSIKQTNKKNLKCSKLGTSRREKINLLYFYFQEPGFFHLLIYYELITIAWVSTIFPCSKWKGFFSFEKINPFRYTVKGIYRPLKKREIVISILKKWDINLKGFSLSSF